MKLDSRFNLIIPVYRDDGTIWAHATPISRAVFETYYRPLCVAYDSMRKDGLSVETMSRVAFCALRDAAQALGAWDTPSGVQNGVIAEIRRITQVSVPTEQGWQAYMLQDAIQRKLIDEQEQSEVENAIVFFTFISHISQRHQLPETLNQMMQSGICRVTLSGSSEFHASLTESIQGGISVQVGA